MNETDPLDLEIAASSFAALGSGLITRIGQWRRERLQT